tara:strand:+ start:593 stop:1108 length:516 start_codon:yes stop_codon:yes gene_type:complete
VKSKKIKGYDCPYVISKDGSLFCESYTDKNGKNRKGRNLKGSINSHGYIRAEFRKNGKRVSVAVHRLVALAFIPNPSNKEEINHINGIKTDNRLENLEWVTRSENQLHAFKSGLQKKRKGIVNPSSKLTEEQVLNIRKVGRSVALKDQALKYGVSARMISYILNRKNWTHI